jgi:antitoxin PrlF
MQTAQPLNTSKLTSKFQTTIPLPVRKALRLQAGDLVGFEVLESGSEVTVRLKRATPLDLAFAQALQGTLSEWSSKADDEAFKDL